MDGEESADSEESEADEDSNDRVAGVTQILVDFSLSAAEDQESTPATKRKEHLLRVQLQRSKGHPLRMAAGELWRPHRLFNILLEHSDRWGPALLNLSSNARSNTALVDIMCNLRGLSGRCSQFHTLELTLTTSRHWQLAMTTELTLEDMRCALQNLPNLTHAKLDGVMLNFVELHWGQLEALVLARNCDCDRVDKVLLQCTRSDRLGMACDAGGSPQDAENGPANGLLLPLVRYLYIDAHGEYLSMLRLRFPKLEQFVLRNDAVTISELNDMIQVSSCSLTTLRIHEVGIEDPADVYPWLEELLGGSPALKKLSWSFWPDTEPKPEAFNGNALFSMLTLCYKSSGESMVCPYLERLDAAQVRFNGDTLFEMLESRNGTQNGTVTTSTQRKGHHTPPRH